MLTAASQSIVSVVLGMYLPRGTAEDPFSGLEAEFIPVARAMVAEQAPTTVTQAIFVAQAIQNALKIYRNTPRGEGQAAGDRGPDDDAGREKERLQAVRDLRADLAELRRCRKDERDRAKAGSGAEGQPGRPEGPGCPPRPPETPRKIRAASKKWRKLIAMVPSVDPTYPVLLRNGLRVEDVMMLAGGEGSRDEDVLDVYPSLWASELAACKACEAEHRQGPFDPDHPYPPDLTVIEGLEGVRLAERWKILPKGSNTLHLPRLPGGSQAPRVVGNGD